MTEHPPKVPMRQVAKVDPSSVEQVRQTIRAISDSGQPIAFEVGDDGSILVPESHTGPVVFALKDDDQLPASMAQRINQSLELIHARDMQYPTMSEEALSSLVAIHLRPGYNFQDVYNPERKSPPSSKRGSRSASKRRYWER